MRTITHRNSKQLRLSRLIDPTDELTLHFRQSIVKPAFKQRVSSQGAGYLDVDIDGER